MAGPITIDDDNDAELAAAIAASLGDSDCSSKRHCAQQRDASAAGSSRVDAPQPTRSSTQASVSKRPVPPEPDWGEGVCELSVRLPTSAQEQRRFLLGVPILDVWAWMEGLGWDMRRHCLAMPYPRRTLTDGNATLAEAGLAPRERLILEPR